MGAKYKITFVIILMLLLCTTKQDGTCSEGMYQVHFEDDSTCLLCPDGTFMNLKDHHASRCFTCTGIKNLTVEVLVTPCSRAQDTHIHCVDGYFRHMDRFCKQCSLCPEDSPQIRRCQSHSDTLCGERPSKCSRGEYLHPNYYDCRKCPENTFMSEDAHRHTKCWDCQYLSDADLPPNTILKQKCTGTQPVEYVCKDGFYMKPSNDKGCHPCQSCGEGMYVGRECGMYHDRVCCSKPNMAVVDIPNNKERCIDEKDEELHFYPLVNTEWVKMNGCQSVFCYTALVKSKAKPLLTWIGPNLDKHQQFNFENYNNLSDVIVYQNTLTLCKFSSASEGEYRCKDSLGKLGKEIQLNVKLACKYGTYNPPACEKNCSQRCKMIDRSDQSPCHHKNGTCLLGCVKGYAGAMCETQKEDSINTSADVAIAVTVSVVLVVILLVFFCVKRKRNNWCTRNVEQPRSRSKVNKKYPDTKTVADSEQQEHLMNVNETTLAGEDLSTAETNTNTEDLPTAAEATQTEDNLLPTTVESTQTEEDPLTAVKTTQTQEDLLTAVKSTQTDECSYFFSSAETTQVNEELLTAIESTQYEENLTTAVKATQTGEENISLDHVKEKVREAVKNLKEMESFHSEEAIGCLNYISNIFFDCHCIRTNIGDFLAELSFPGICMKIFDGYLRMRGNVNDDDIWFVINLTYKMCRNFTASSVMFAKSLRKADVVQLMTNVLSQETYLDNVDKERECDVVKACMFGLRHIATGVRVKNMQEFQKSNTLEVLMSLAKCNNKSIRAFGMITLTSILKEDVSQLTDTTGTIETIVKWTRKALNSNDRKYEGFTPRALLASLASLAINDENRKTIVQAGALNVCRDMLQQTDQKGQSWAAICLRRVAKDETLRQAINDFPELLQALENLKNSENEYVKGNVASALKAISGQA